MNAKERGLYFRPLDLFIIIIFLSIAAVSIEMFRRDLTQTLTLRNVEPVGTVVIKRNTVQRRLNDRVLWDRLAKESPVYIGDLIRVADISSATLYIDDNSIDLNENTLIRITRAADGEGVQLVLSEGTVSLTAGTEGRNVNLDLNGVQVQAARGTVLSAGASGAGDVSVQVNEGAAQIVEKGGAFREIPTGTAAAFDAGGKERLERAAVVTRPAPNARYVKNTKGPLTVNFTWNRINLASAERLRMEISSDGNFTRVSNTINNLNAQARAQFDTGLWYWRLLFEDTVLSTGNITIADGSGPELQSPAFNSLFRYSGDLPVLNFQWAQVDEAVSYVIEVSSTVDFSDLRFRRQSSAASMTDSSLGEGTWFWRVRPVFPSVFSGSAVYSTASFFRVERISSATTAAAEGTSLSRWLAALAPSDEIPSEVPQEIIPPPPPPQIRLSSPARGARIDGLIALRQETVFRWETTGKFISSRFVLSRNDNPLQGQPAREIANPNRVVRLDGLAEGTWYWTVELLNAEGVIVSAPPRSLQVSPIPLLPSPQNLRPVRETVFGLQNFRTQRTIVFSWAAVRGANAYIFTLYQQTQGSRRQIVSETINSDTGYTLTDLSLLDRGAFVWQVEAVNIRGDAVEQRGTTGESAFTVDFPSSAPLQMEDAGILYGN